MLDVREIAGHEIIDRDDPMPFRQQSIGQMRPEKTRAAGDDRNWFEGAAMRGFN